MRHKYVLIRAYAWVATRGRPAWSAPQWNIQRLHFAGSSHGKEEGDSARCSVKLRLFDDLVNTKLPIMKLLWAVSALLLSCWRASASTGKNFVSAMLGWRCNVNVRLCPYFEQSKRSSDSCFVNVNFFWCRILFAAAINTEFKTLYLAFVGYSHINIIVLLTTTVTLANLQSQNPF